MSDDELEIMNCGVEPLLDLGGGLKDRLDSLLGFETGRVGTELKRGLDSMFVEPLSSLIGRIGKELKGGLADLDMGGQGPRIQSLDSVFVGLGMAEKGGLGTVGGGLKRRLDGKGVPGMVGGGLKGGLLSPWYGRGRTEASA